MKKIFLVLNLVLIFSACGEIKEYYKKEGGVVYFENEKINNADFDSFEVLHNDYYNSYSKDKNNVYCGDDIIKGANADSFEVLSSVYAKDKNQVFVDCGRGFKENEIKIDVKTVEFIQSEYNFDWAKDKDSIYFYGEKMVDSDPNSFVILDDDYSKDKNNVYIFDSGEYAFKIESADPSTFEVLKNGYSKDKNNCYFRNGDIVEMSKCGKLKNIF